MERGSNVDHTVPPKGRLVLDSQYTASGLPTSYPRVMLIEDFSGISCVNCPDAAKIIAGIDSSNPGKMVDLTMYSNLDVPLSDSFLGSKSSYRTNASDVLRTLLGPVSVGNLPRVCLNRKFFSGETEIAFSKNNLVSYFTSELSANATATSNITFLSKSFDAASGTITAKIKVEYGAAIPDSEYLSVAIKEDNLSDCQEVPKGSGGASTVDSHYVHNAVLRKYVYPQNSFLLPGVMAGKTFIISFNTTIPSGWNPSNLKMVAIIHKQNAASANYLVTQVAETTIK